MEWEQAELDCGPSGGGHLGYCVDCSTVFDFLLFVFWWVSIRTV